MDGFVEYGGAWICRECGAVQKTPEKGVNACCKSMNDIFKAWRINTKGDIRRYMKFANRLNALLSPIFEGMRYYYKHEQELDIRLANNRHLIVTPKIAKAFIEQEIVKEEDILDWEQISRGLK